MQDAGYWPFNFIHSFFPSCMGSSILARNLFRDETPRETAEPSSSLPCPLHCAETPHPTPRKQQNVDETLTSLRRLGITANGRTCHIGNAEQRKAASVHNLYIALNTLCVLISTSGDHY